MNVPPPLERILSFLGLALVAVFVAAALHVSGFGSGFAPATLTLESSSVAPAPDDTAGVGTTALGWEAGVGAADSSASNTTTLGPISYTDRVAPGAYEIRDGKLGCLALVTHSGAPCVAWRIVFRNGPSNGANFPCARCGRELHGWTFGANSEAFRLEIPTGTPVFDGCVYCLAVELAPSRNPPPESPR